LGNRQRIIETAKVLMNARGAAAIGTTQISDALQISPGNLYYHFNNKEEIVRTLFDKLDHEFRVLITDRHESPISTARFITYYQNSLELAWNYRFFFSGLLHLLRRDELLCSRYLELQCWAMENLENIARQLVSEGSMRKPRSRNGYKAITLNMWLVWSNWVRHKQISSPERNATQEDMLEGALQVFDLLSPYLTESYDRAARRAFTKSSLKHKGLKPSTKG